MPDQPYARAPILECVMDVRFADRFGDDRLKKLRDRLKKAYPSVHERHEYEIHVEGGKPPRVMPKPGYHLAEYSELNLVILLADGVAALRRAPYTGWEDLQQRMSDLLEITRSVVGFFPVNRVAVRYINRIDIPAEPGERTNLFDYVLIGPLMPQSPLVPDLDSFHVRTQFELPDRNCSAVVQVAVGPNVLVKHVSVTLDIDVFRTGKLSGKSSDIIGELSSLREIKNGIFEASISDKARSLFK